MAETSREILQKWREEKDKLMQEQLRKSIEERRKAAEKGPA